MPRAAAWRPHRARAAARLLALVACASAAQAFLPTTPSPAPPPPAPGGQQPGLPSHEDAVAELRVLRDACRAGCLESTAFGRARDAVLAGVVAPPDAGDCAVCLESVAEPAAGKRLAVVEGCLHAFCLDCILQWTARSAPGHGARTAGGAPGRVLHGGGRPQLRGPRGEDAHPRTQSCPAAGLADGRGGTATPGGGRGPPYGGAGHRHAACPLCKQPILRCARHVLVARRECVCVCRLYRYAGMTHAMRVCVQAVRAAPGGRRPGRRAAGGCMET